jgi:hypothetical protein
MAEETVNSKQNNGPEQSRLSGSRQANSRELGTECDIESCDERVVGLDDGWEYERGVVCSSCIEFRQRHHHWPDEDVETCRECILDDGGAVHDCPETSIDVLLRPGDNCPNCEFELAATDGGQQASGVDRETPTGMEAGEDWMREHGIVGHGGRHKNENRTVWALDVPEDAEVRVNLTVTLPNGETVTWGGSNMPGQYELVQKTGDLEDQHEQTPQDEWEEHNEPFTYEPPQKPPEAWSSSEYQELYDRVISRRTEWFCDECSGRGPIGTLKKARRHVEKQHGSDLVEKHAPNEDELETATDGGKSSKTEKHESENHGLAEFSGGEQDA